MNEILTISKLKESIQNHSGHNSCPFEITFGIRSAENMLNEIFKENGVTVKISQDAPPDYIIVKAIV